MKPEAKNLIKLETSELMTDQENKIALVYKDPARPAQVRAKGFVVLSVSACLYHGERVQKLHQRTPHHVMTCIGSKSTWDVIGQLWESEDRPYDLLHLVGRVDLTLKLLDSGVTKIQWEHPEAGLHPEWQLGIADMLIKLSEAYGREGGDE